MAVEAQRKEDTMGEFEKVPSSISVHGEKDEEDDYYSYSDSVDDLRSENSWSDSSPQVILNCFTLKNGLPYFLFIC